jgi:hypothetical protein
MNLRIPILAVLALTLGVSSVLAETKGYKIERPDGSVEFSDQPAPGAREITLPGAQGYEAPPPPSFTPPPRPEPKGPLYSQLTITAPTPDQTLHNGETAVNVSVQLVPALRPGHRLVVLLDGSEAAGGAGTGFALAGVERGSHVLVAEVRDSRGTVMQSSAPVTFHLRQTSILTPRRPAPTVPTP